MNTIVFNGKRLEVSEEKTILEIAKENEIYIPTLCFLKECKNMDKCGVCLVEIEGEDELAKACCTKTKDGMVINNDEDNERVQNAIKERVSEILSEHDFNCGKCNRVDDCELLTVISNTEAKITKEFVKEENVEYIDNRSKSIVLDKSKCIKCGRCVAACREKSGTSIMKFTKVGDNMVVGPENLKCFDDTNCILCGQCVSACPVGALFGKPHIDRVKNALEDPKKHVIVAIAPAVRTALGEAFDMGYGVDVTGKIYTALRKLGFNKVFDINFGADVTIMEEGTELIERIKNNGPFPMFTSCCPGWIRLVENYHPELLNNLSSAKSPQQIFGAISKSYYPAVENINAEDVFTVTIMPCTAKKFEADRDEMIKDGLKDIDAVLTTRELANILRENRIKLEELEESDADPVIGEYTGAGTIFGVTGGVMEAALRTCKDLLEKDKSFTTSNKAFSEVAATLDDEDKNNLNNLEYEKVRGFEGIKEATVNIAGSSYNIAVVNGAKNLFDFIKSGKINEKSYHFIEVMACPGGCINGGGQPRLTPELMEDIDIKTERASVLYNQDKNLPKRKSHRNESVLKMYDKFMGQPGKGKAHELLHVKYKAKN